MKVKIALLVKAHFARYCRDTFLTETEEMVLSFFTYVTLEEMVATYQTLLGKYDAVIVSGLLPYTILHNVAQPGHPILECFRYDIENTYRIILRESIKRQCLDLSRVGIEALPPGVSLQQAINENTFPHYAKLFEGQFLSLDFEALKQQEEEISIHYKKLYAEGKIDYILTYFYSAVETMQKLGIDCYYLYPSEKEFYRVIDLVCTKVSLQQAEKRSPAVIHLTLRPTQMGAVGNELKITELYAALLEYIKLHQYDISVKQGTQYFHLYTDAKTLEQMTGGFHFCPLSQHIPLVNQLCSAVGYGVGNSFFRATKNALEAAQYALELDSASKASYYIDNNGTITALSHKALSQETWIDQLPKEKLVALAEQASLSVDTIVKILSVLHAMDSKQLTSQDLIERLGLSLRTANRYLANLTKAGLAQTVGQKAMVKKGRPVNIYSLAALAKDLL